MRRWESLDVSVRMPYLTCTCKRASKQASKHGKEWRIQLTIKISELVFPAIRRKKQDTPRCSSLQITKVLDARIILRLVIDLQVQGSIKQMHYVTDDPFDTTRKPQTSNHVCTSWKF